MSVLVKRSRSPIAWRLASSASASEARSEGVAVAGRLAGKADFEEHARSLKRALPLFGRQHLPEPAGAMPVKIWLRSASVPLAASAIGQFDEAPPSATRSALREWRSANAEARLQVPLGWQLVSGVGVYRRGSVPSRIVATSSKSFLRSMTSGSTIDLHTIMLDNHATACNADKHKIEKQGRPRPGSMGIG